MKNNKVNCKSINDELFIACVIINLSSYKLKYDALSHFLSDTFFVTNFNNKYTQKNVKKIVIRTSIQKFQR